MPNELTPPALTSCEREAIHAPGSIQPHGMMLVAAQDSLAVLHAAGDIEQRLGPVDWVGHPLRAIIGDTVAAEVRTLAESGTAGGFAGQLRASSGELLDVSARLSPPYVIVELEAASLEILPAAKAIDRLAAAAARFERTSSLAGLCDRAAIEFRLLTGFDRVMLYRILDDDAGKVLAEDRRDDLRSFLNHHFPGSDIPRQARALYVRNLLRVIPDAAYRPVALRPAWTAPAPLDMSDCSLRSVSPLHLVYLRNMGVKASASFSIVREGRLWGLIVCHHDTPRVLTYDVRAACRSLVGSLARQIRAKDEAESVRQRLRLRSSEDDIIALLSREGSLDEALSNHLDEIGRMMDGDGIAVLRGHELVTNGACPAPEEIRGLAAWLLADRSTPILSTSQLATLFPPAKDFERLSAGLLSITLSIDEPWLVLWFRAEQVEIVNWAGNPHKRDPLSPNAESRAAPPSPRASFEAWTETVRGRARSWSVPEVDAATRLRAALLDARQNRRVAELNRQLTRILQDKDLLLQQKEFLISEVNHRVQNSLSLVSSFLGLQDRRSNNPELHTALDEARRRITAVALVHRRLYRGHDVEVVDAARYIEELCADAFSFMGPDWALRVTLNLVPVLVSTDQAVTLGLVITELLINANKHAYAGAAGPIEVELIEDGHQFHVVVSDRGKGKGAAPKGFGSRVMDGLIQQLAARLTHADNDPGLRVTVTVPFQRTAMPGHALAED